MRPARWLDRAAVAGGVFAAAQLGVAAATLATIVGGGGSPTADCLAVFDAAVNSPTNRPRNVVCVDGKACDNDGMVNGSCDIVINLCANSTDPAVAGCTVNGVESITVEHAQDNGDEKFDPDFQALQNKVNDIALPTSDPDVCPLAATHVHVPIKGPFRNNACRHNRKIVRVTTVSMPVAALGGRVFTDKDKIKLTCEPSPDVNGCDPQTLYAGTFDRIQTQIFNQSCAVSGCHDSTSQQKGLLLETGASYGHLVNVDPQTPAAFAAGWKLVAQLSPTMGDSSTSFLYHKVKGDLPDDTYGLRMPRKRARLNSTLIDVIQLWIDAGAPMDGWVPGTF